MCILDDLSLDCIWVIEALDSRDILPLSEEIDPTPPPMLLLLTWGLILFRWSVLRFTAVGEFAVRTALVPFSSSNRIAASKSVYIHIYTYIVISQDNLQCIQVTVTYL